MNDGVNPKFWGKCFWKGQELEIESLPELPRDDTRGALKCKLRFLKQLGLFLPCLMCRQHYVQNAKKVCAWMADHNMPMDDTVTRARLHYFWWNVHDVVNHITDKPKAVRATHTWEWYKQKYPGARGPLTTSHVKTVMTGFGDRRAGRSGGYTSGPLCAGIACPPSAN
jgi:hypothetical protein